MRGRVSADVNGGRHAGSRRGGFLSPQIVGGILIPLAVIRHSSPSCVHRDGFHPGCDPADVPPTLDMCHSKLLSRPAGRERRGVNGFLTESFITDLDDGAQADTSHQCSGACFTLLPFIAPFLLQLSHHLSSRRLPPVEKKHHTHTPLDGAHYHLWGLFVT